MDKETSGKFNLWMIGFFLLLALFMFILGRYGLKVLPFQKDAAQPTPSVALPPTVTETQVLPTTTPLPSPTTKPTTPLKSDLEQIKQAFAKKYNKPLNEVSVTISKQEGKYASGSVKFSGEISGAMWLAYKQGDNWTTVYDGQGTISCDLIAPYDFPSSMVSECIDSEGNLITR